MSMRLPWPRVHERRAGEVAGHPPLDGRQVGLAATRSTVVSRSGSAAKRPRKKARDLARGRGGSRTARCPPLRRRSSAPTIAAVSRARERLEVAATRVLDHLALRDPASRRASAPRRSRPRTALVAWAIGAAAYQRIGGVRRGSARLSGGRRPTRSTSAPTAAGPPSPAARTTRLPTITPSATSATARACRRSRSRTPPPPERRWPRERAATVAARSGGGRRARRWCRSARPRRRSRGRRRRSRHALGRCWSGATSGTSARPSASHAARSSPASSWGRSGTISPAAPAAAARSAKASAPAASTMFA